MTREQYLKQLIQCNGHSLKSFAQSIDMPYTTLLSMLKNGLGGASLNHVFQICLGLQITVEQLQAVLNESEMIIPFCINAHEKQVVTQYRNLPDMQAAVNKLLDVKE